MQKKIVLSPNFFDELEELLDALLAEGYFSALPWALQYTDAIERFIETSLGVAPTKTVPHVLKEYGTNYITYIHSQRTTWYIIFDETEDLYYVRHITNNHVSGHYFNG